MSATSRARDPNPRVVKDKILEHLREGLSMQSAADLELIDRKTMWRWRVADPTWSAECRKAIAEWKRTEWRNVDDSKWKLERRLPKEFSPRQDVHQFTSDDEDDRDEFADMSTEELERLARGEK